MLTQNFSSTKSQPPITRERGQRGTKGRTGVLGAPFWFEVVCVEMTEIEKFF